MIILGAAAALYILLLLHRLTVLALPIGAGLLLASLLHENGSGWAGAIGGGLLAGISLYLVGRTLVTGRFPLLVRLPVLLLFSGAAACAGYQAGAALAVLGGLDMAWQRSLAILVALITAAASWRDLAPRTSGTETAAP